MEWHQLCWNSFHTLREAINIQDSGSGSKGVPGLKLTDISRNTLETLLELYVRKPLSGSLVEINN